MIYHPPFWLWLAWGSLWSLAAILFARKLSDWEQAFGLYILFILPAPVGTLFSVAATCWMLGWVS